jgi:hypothetical protein
VGDQVAGNFYRFSNLHSRGIFVHLDYGLVASEADNFLPNPARLPDNVKQADFI